MKTKTSVFLTAVLAAALLGMTVFGAQAAIRASAARRTLEYTYFRSLLEAQEQLQSIALQLGKTPAAGDARTQVALLAAVSREANGAAGSLTALPLSHRAMSDTVKFCNQLSEYTMTLALGAADGASPTEEDLSQLKNLQTQCTLLLGQLATAQDAITRQSLRLARPQSAFYLQAQPDERPPEQVAADEGGMDYPAMIYDGAFSDARREGTPKGLGTGQTTLQQAMDIARQFVGNDRVAEVREGASAGGTIAAHGVTLTLTDGTVLNAEVTVQGGHLLWMMPESAAFETLLSAEECAAQAQAFLQARGYPAMEVGGVQQYNALAVVDLIALQDGVLLYPDQIKLQMRMDTGEAVGMEARQYLMNHSARADLSPALSQQEALARLSPLLNVQRVRLCVIPMGDAERLCYEATGLYDGRTYLVYTDARTGEELKVLMTVDGAQGPLTV